MIDKSMRDTVHIAQEYFKNVNLKSSTSDLF
jgi:hypothetical protein